jgi:hypothetical protein
MLVMKNETDSPDQVLPLNRFLAKRTLSLKLREPLYERTTSDECK